MKLIIAIALLISTVSYSQSSLTGKWKPVFFSLDSLTRGDVKADTLFISAKLKENFKNDKDPEGSENMVRFFIEMVFEKMKETQEEYFNDGKYVEINTRTGRSKTGTYVFNEKEKTLQKMLAPVNKKDGFLVSWKNGLLVLTGEMESSNGKKGKIEIMYEKI